ncbi:hypothetical protein GCM10023205_52920 [Yinghuangia aomiensis]|uniref:Amidohydrolase n=1 Tax=Yinghuangia aomiensis TaxID=676205 RepID=A0ABP9HTR0_9ACTN
MTLERKISRAAYEMADDARRFREDLARHPEPAWEEYDTTEKIAAKLAMVGFRPVIARSGLGVVAEVGPRDRPVVVLRSDIDALRVEDARNVPYRSQNPGVHHGCGHDVTTSGLVHAAEILSDIDKSEGLPNRVRLVFQPAEEPGEGAMRMIREDGVLDNAVAAFGMHSWPRIHVGGFGVVQGLIQNSHHAVDLHLRGPGGHASRPTPHTDLTRVGNKFSLALQEGMEKLAQGKGPEAQPIFVFPMQRGSEARNALPTEAYYGGSIRFGDLEAYRNAPEQLRHLADDFAERTGFVNYELNITHAVPPVVNTCADKVAEALAAGRGPTWWSVTSRGRRAVTTSRSCSPESTTSPVSRTPTTPSLASSRRGAHLGAPAKTRTSTRPSSTSTRRHPATRCTTTP